MNDKLLAALGEIKDDYVLEATPAGRRTIPWRRWAALAACLCLIAAGVWGFTRRQTRNTTVDEPGPVLPAASEDGVTLPRRELHLAAPKENEAFSMIPFFIYDGRSYIGSFDRAAETADLVGERLGTVTGLINEWTPRDGYVDLAGSATGDFYSVQGFDPAFLLCQRLSNGQLLLFYNDNGRSFTRGSDLYETLLHLSERYASVEYESHNSWQSSAGLLHRLGPEHAGAVERFVAALDGAPFCLIDGYEENWHQTIYEHQRYHLYFCYDNGMRIHLRLMEGGYVTFDGIPDICVKLSDGSFDELAALLDSGAGTPAEPGKPGPLTYPELAAEPTLGGYLPAYIPEGAAFIQGSVQYQIDRETGAVGAANTLHAEFDLDESGRTYYAVTVYSTAGAGQSGYGGPVYDADALTLADVERCLHTTTPDGRPRDPDRYMLAIAVRTGDVIVELGAVGMDAEIGYAILNSVK